MTTESVRMTIFDGRNDIITGDGI